MIVTLSALDLELNSKFLDTDRFATKKGDVFRKMDLILQQCSVKKLNSKSKKLLHSNVKVTQRYPS